MLLHYKVKEVVVFEELYQDNILVAIHAEIEDKGQTVKFKEVKPAQPKPEQPNQDKKYSNYRTTKRATTI